MRLICQQKRHSVSAGTQNKTHLRLKHLDEKSLARPVMLSMVSKIYDTLGFAAPLLLKGKRILQVLCNNNYSWDEILSDDYIKDWNEWKRELQLLEGLEINKCFKPTKFCELN